MEVEQYIKALQWELRRLPKDESSEAVNYYKEYFEEAVQASENGDYDPVKEFGPPKDLAAKIIQDSAGKIMEEPPKTAKKSMSAVWVVILAILASPIALPIGLSLVVVMAAMIFIVVIFIGVFLICGAAVLFAGIIGIAVSIRIMFASFPTGLLFLGCCLSAIGIGGLITIAFYYLGKLLIVGIVRLFGRNIKKRKEKKSVE